MHSRMNLAPVTRRSSALCVLALAGMVATGLANAADPPAVPTIFVAGDSTAAAGSPRAAGWGKPFATLFDPAKAKVVNAARGGRSSRTFVNEGLWDKLIADVKPGDYVLIQFGHNDGGPVNSAPARGSLPGIGDETQEIEHFQTKKSETVHTFGWYVKKMVRETKAKGAMPILMSLTVRNIWRDGKVERGSGKFGQWTQELAKADGIAFIDLTRIVGDRYDEMGPDAVKAMFPQDHTHTNEAGADLNARFVVSGIKALRENAIIKALVPDAGKSIAPAPASTIMHARLSRPAGVVAGSGTDAWFAWLNLPEPADPALPSVILVSDSTVRTSRGDGGGGQWGWGDPIAAYFDPMKANVVNRAVGGTGTRTFLAQGYWDRVMKMTKPGDVVVIQFGHNDNGATGPIRGTGEETEERTANGKTETVHTFGWYMRKYIADVREKGATPVVCSLIPRNNWRDGKITRGANSHADWAKTVATAEKVPFLDLHEVIAQKYEQMGQEAVMPLFADQRVHTSRAGAELNASCVVEALKMLPENPVAKYLREKPAPTW